MVLLTNQTICSLQQRFSPVVLLQPIASLFWVTLFVFYSFPAVITETAHKKGRNTETLISLNYVTV